MNRKGEQNVMLGIGVLFVAFLTIVVGLALYSGGIVGSIGEVTQLGAISNDSITLPANGSSTVLSGKVISGFTAINASTGEIVNANNYTLNNNEVVNGVLQASISPTVDSNMFSHAINVTYTFQPLTYASEGGTRGIVPLIAIFMALAIALLALVPVLKSGALDFIKG
jgi:hypothetical protein|tara:strand:+ start:224 stop:727 length:504 start_codon:yes stop_codon:yes gene_type:complete